MVILSHLWPISRRPPGAGGCNCKGGDKMVLRLYHYEKGTVTVYDVIKVSIDDNRQISVRVKEESDIKNKFYHYEKDYQRLTIQVD